MFPSSINYLKQQLKIIKGKSYVKKNYYNKSTWTNFKRSL
jgi:hypothetical protein